MKEVFVVEDATASAAATNRSRRCNCRRLCARRVRLAFRLFICTFVMTPRSAIPTALTATDIPARGSALRSKTNGEPRGRRALYIVDYLLTRSCYGGRSIEYIRNVIRVHSKPLRVIVKPETLFDEVDNNSPRQLQERRSRIPSFS